MHCKWACSPLLFRNATDFCILILHPADSLHSCILMFLLVSRGLLCVLWYACDLSRLTSSSEIWMPFSSVSCLITLAGLNTMLNKNGEVEHPCLVLILEEKLSAFTVALSSSYGLNFPLHHHRVFILISQNFPGFQAVGISSSLSGLFCSCGERGLLLIVDILTFTGSMGFTQTFLFSGSISKSVICVYTSLRSHFW